MRSKFEMLVDGASEPGVYAGSFSFTDSDGYRYTQILRRGIHIDTVWIGWADGRR